MRDEEYSLEKYKYERERLESKRNEYKKTVVMSSGTESQELNLQFETRTYLRCWCKISPLHLST